MSKVSSKVLQDYIKSQKELKDKLKEYNLNRNIKQERINEDLQTIILPLKQSVVNSNNLNEGLNNLKEDLNISIPKSNSYLKSINENGDEFLNKLNDLEKESKIMRSEIKKLTPTYTEAKKDIEKLQLNFSKLLPLSSNKSSSTSNLNEILENPLQRANSEIFSTPNAKIPTPLDLTMDTSSNNTDNTLSSPVNFIENRFGNTAMKYLNLNSSGDRVCDNVFGLRSEDGKDLWIGDSEVKINGNDIIVKNKTYEGTKGLWELVTLKEPSANVTNNDLKNYEEIILGTYAYMQNNDKNSRRVKSSAGNKYINYIRPILVDRKILKEKTGSGIDNFKIFTKSPVEYVYWNDVQELKDRLLLLLGEYDAGNDSPQIHNEIMNIIEELKEENVI
jgi:hypothetical protein